jgi:hypothetical protein
MKFSILIVSYLSKDTWKRWCEQPGSPLARWFVTALLVTVATVILVAFQLLERGLQDRLARFGLDTLLVRQNVTPGSVAFFRQGDGPDALGVLASNGRKLRLRQLFVRASTEWQQENLYVFSYPPNAMPLLTGMLTADTPVICLSDSLPLGAETQVQIGHRTLLAKVARPQNWLRGLAMDSIILVPQGWIEEEEEMGWIETTVFQRSSKAPPMDRIINAVYTLSSVDQRQPPQIQSALPLVRELEDLKRRRVQWEGLLAAMLGGAVALVYGAIAVLEFRQNLFVGALLRSFGAPSFLLYLKYWIENVLLVNFAAFTAVMLTAILHSEIFGGLGLPREALNSSGGNPFLSAEVLSVFLWINAGALLSSLPVAIGLRQPVGEILS